MGSDARSTEMRNQIVEVVAGLVSEILSQTEDTPRVFCDVLNSYFDCGSRLNISHLEPSATDDEEPSAKRRRTQTWLNESWSEYEQKATDIKGIAASILIKWIASVPSPTSVNAVAA